MSHYENLMINKQLLVFVFAIVLGQLTGCQDDVASGDPVEVTVKNISTLIAKVQKQYPKGSIQQYKNVTDDLIKDRLMPNGFLKNGKAENAWSGKMIVQVFPENAWRAGVPSTVNYVIEAVPEKDCSRLIDNLSRQLNPKIFQINVEPSKKLHTVFPVAGDTGCAEGINNIGYTVFAE
jgi:hypothetical protein